MTDYKLPIFNYDITIDDSQDANQMMEYLWRNSTATVGMAKRLYPPFYSDDEIDLRLVNRRVKGTINLNIFCSSLPELFDIRQCFQDAFWGYNCYRRAEIRPYTVIPDSFMLQDCYGKSVTKKILDQHICRHFMKAINMDKYYLISNTSVLINLGGLNQNSSNYGGANLPEHSLTGTCSFELEMPQYIMATSRIYDRIVIDVSTDYDFRHNDIKMILSSYLGKPLSMDEGSSNIKFENGKVTHWVVYNVRDTKTNSIDFHEVMPEPRSFDLSDRERELILVFSGGMIFCKEPGVNIIDGHIMDFSPISFLKDEILEFIVFEPNKKVGKMKNE
jgi:hypothetical protein